MNLIYDQAVPGVFPACALTIAPLGLTDTPFFDRRFDNPLLNLTGEVDGTIYTKRIYGRAAQSIVLG
jgi:hypothetical protein